MPTSAACKWPSLCMRAKVLRCVKCLQLTSLIANLDALRCGLPLSEGSMKIALKLAIMVTTFVFLAGHQHIGVVVYS
jgi:hypothetical protein